MKSIQSILISVAALFTVTTLGILSLSSDFVSADEYAKDSAMIMNNESAESVPMGKHNMSGTIETINSRTGWMKLKTAMGVLTIHYPPPTVKDLKKGDNITVHLSYTKDDDKMKDGKMK